MIDFLEDDEWLRRLQEQSPGTIGPSPTPEIPTPGGESEAQLRARILAEMPELSPMPERADLSDAKRADAMQDAMRGFERASKEASYALAGLPGRVSQGDLVTEKGSAEAVASERDSQNQKTALGLRTAEMAARQRALSELLKPGPHTKSPEELEAIRLRSEAAKSNAETYATRTKNEAELAREKLAERRERARTLRPPKEAPGGDGKTLPATEVSGLSELPVAEAQVDKLVETFNRLNMGGMSGRASGFATDVLGLRSTDAAEYNAAAQLGMQAAGKIMEGGKLAAGDEVKYKKMLPAPGDSDAVVKQKAEGLKAHLRDLAGRRAQAFKEAGYKVPTQFLQGGPEASKPAPRIARNPKTGERRFINPDGSLGEVVK